ncbi:putative PC-Esterase [Dioscorea sansibarensis]
MNVYKDKEDTSNIWFFNSSNFTLMSNFIKFLVQATEITINGTKTGVFDIHMDKVDTEWANKLQKTHYVVISTGHWFFRKNYFHENGKLVGCTFCSETNLKEINLNTAIKRATRTALEFIKNTTTEEHHLDESHKTVTLLRTYSPAHFEGGAWNDGGYCNRTKPLETGEMWGGSDMEVRNGQVEELEKVKGSEGESGVVEFGVVDVTESMMVRADGHPGKHWNNEWMKGFNDCVHWCLPGAVDVWNDMMLQVMRRFSSF